MAILALLVALLVGAVTAKRISAPISRVIQAAQLIASGDYAITCYLRKKFSNNTLFYRIQRNMISLNRDQSMESGFGLLDTEIIELGQKNLELRNDYRLIL